MVTDNNLDMLFIIGKIMFIYCAAILTILFWIFLSASQRNLAVLGKKASREKACISSGYLHRQVYKMFIVRTMVSWILPTSYDERHFLLMAYLKSEITHHSDRWGNTPIECFGTLVIENLTAAEYMETKFPYQLIRRGRFSIYFKRWFHWNS